MSQLLPLQPAQQYISCAYVVYRLYSHQLLTKKKMFMDLKNIFLRPFSHANEGVNTVIHLKPPARIYQFLS